MNKRLQFILFFSLCLLSQGVFAQINFFTDDEQDSLTNNFYELDKSITAIAIVNVPSWQFGCSFFMHNSSDKVSYFVEAKSNIRGRYIISGEECYGTGIRQKEVAYTVSVVNVGLARGFTRNWFVYGGVGAVVKQTYYDNKIEENYRYSVPNQGIWFNMVCGAMYVTDSNLSFLAGMDLYDRSVSVGFGYTF